ncbi:MAG: DUF3108 domain-containing protein, partial [Acidobacteria bacterium]|nr:DUF3108 domain-containing protein [Acidobacteriota bacterium]
MKKTTIQPAGLNRQRAFLYLTRVILTMLGGALAFGIYSGVSAQTDGKPENLPPTPFRIGEKLTYTVSFARFTNVGFAELSVVSRGKLSGRDAVELHSKFKTSELVAAAFYLLDESRTTYAAADSGLPLYIRKTSDEGVLPKQQISNFLAAPTPNYDLLTLVYRLRGLGGFGSLMLQEDDRIYSVSAVTGPAERIKTVAGEFDTVVSTVQSEFFSEKGFRDFRVNFSADDRKIPV